MKERPPLEEMTLRQLRKVASECGVSRYSRMRKDQLLAAIQDIQRGAMTLTSARTIEAQEVVEAAKFDVGQVDRMAVSLAVVDEGLPDLPDGYGESRIVLMPRDPRWAYIYWDVPEAHKSELRSQGGMQLALRLYDATDVNLEFQSPPSIQEYPCDEMAREWYLPVPVSDRDYVIDIGYRCVDGRWLLLARSATVRIPPVYPSDWIEDLFLTVDWEEDLQGKTLVELTPPARRQASTSTPTHHAMFGLAESVEAQRVDGSLFGSMQHVAGSVFGSMQMVGEQALSSYVFPSGMGMWASGAALESWASGIGMSGLTMSGVGMSGLTMSGVGMSGLTMSGVGISASAPPIRPRKFWLIADAELIVYGATEPDAIVTIGGRPIKLNSDGTFRFQMSFQDGLIDFPIMAVAADGEQTREVHLSFTRETPKRRTNTKEEAMEEWLA
jgi:hypothetical protein